MLSFGMPMANLNVDSVGLEESDSYVYLDEEVNKQFLKIPSKFVSGAHPKFLDYGQKNIKKHFEKIKKIKK